MQIERTTTTLCEIRQNWKDIFVCATWDKDYGRKYKLNNIYHKQCTMQNGQAYVLQGNLSVEIVSKKIDNLETIMTWITTLYTSKKRAFFYA